MAGHGPATTKLKSRGTKKITLKKRLVKSAGVIGLATFASRIFGLFRDIFSASVFGTGPVWDAFIIAFMIPNFLRGLLGEGALSSAFIPVFTEYLEKKSPKEAWRLVGNVLGLLVLLLAAITLGGILVIEFLLANFSFPDKVILILKLARFTLPYIFFISLVALSMGILNSFKHFLIPSLSPTLLNLCWLGSLFFLCPLFGENLEKKIFGLAIGILFAGVMQLGIQIPALVRKGFRPHLGLDIHHPGVRKIGVLMLPGIFGLAITQANITVDKILGYLLGDGAVSSLWYGNRLMQFPLALFGIAMGVAILPTMSTLAAQEKIDKLKETLTFALKLVFFITIPASAGLIFLRIPIMKLLFERGAFDSFSTQRAASCLFFYATGLFAYAGIKVLTPVFYSFKDTVTPMKIGAIAMLSNIALNLLLMWKLREGGLALATALSAALNLILLFRILRRRIGRIGGRRIADTFLKTILASCVMVVVLSLLKLNVLALILIGALVFFAASYMLKIEEARLIARWILAKVKT